MSYMNSQFDHKRHLIYEPKNPQKYVSKDPRIICRSSYELKFCQWLDHNINVLEWASENIEIPYFDPTSQKKRRYFPDFYAKMIDKTGKVKKFIIEIKPSKETKPPRNSKKKSQKSLLYEHKVWTVNQAKWKAADNYCQKWGFEFKIVTEKQLFK